MLKRFLFQSLTSFTGAAAALLLGAVLIALIVGGIISGFTGSSDDTKAEMKAGSILSISLDGEIAECEKAFTPSLSMLFTGKFEAPQTLKRISEALDEAAANKDITAVYLECGDLAAAPATLDALRKKIIDFRKATNGQKPVYAYAENFTQGAYFVASSADSIFMCPEGQFELSGLAVSAFYYKELLDKAGVKMQVSKVGTYKSAVEPYLLEHMSEPARAQLDSMNANIWAYIKDNIRASRPGITPELIDSLVSRDHITFARPSMAVRAKLVDGLLYDRQMKRKLAAASGKKPDELNIVEIATLMEKAQAEKPGNDKNSIAVLYAVGDIADGDENEIDYSKFVPIITKLADDDNVKGLVLRVNSPGGSVYGSALIGEALDYFQSKGKPLAVSMGDYAASGGYWISAKANRIFANPTTVTGSIGIFGMYPCIEGTAHRLGINVELVATNPGAIFPNLFEEMSPEQMEVLQAYVDDGYDRFVTRVAEGRRMDKEQVLRIAEGRVWDGMTARRIGLVDELGGLDDAIAYIAEKTGAGEDYSLQNYPEFHPSMMDMMMGGAVSAADLKMAFEKRDIALIETYFVKKLTARYPVQARMGEFRIDL